MVALQPPAPIGRRLRLGSPRCPRPVRLRRALRLQLVLGPHPLPTPLPTEASDGLIMRRAVAITLLLSPLAAAIDNGLARTPPMTWSSPSLFYAHPSQPAC